MPDQTSVRLNWLQSVPVWMANTAIELESTIPPHPYLPTIKLGHCQRTRQMLIVRSRRIEDHTRRHLRARRPKHRQPHILAPKERLSHSQNSAAGFTCLRPRKTTALQRNGGKVQPRRLRDGERPCHPRLDILRSPTISIQMKISIHIAL
jgi:hypothetical protein